MSALPPTLSVTVALPRKACVFDVPLALSPHGLLTACRLSLEFDLFLVREFWQILDNTEHYLHRPDLLAAQNLTFQNIGCSVMWERKGNLARVLQQWDLARTEKDLGGLKVFWIGDAPNESLLPSGTPPSLVERFEILAHALENKIAPSRDQIQRENQIFNDCFRDAAALVAALIPYRGFILTCAESEYDAPPSICHFLAEHHIECRPIDESDQFLQIERPILAQIISRAGLAELMWAGLRLAVVHLIVPDAVLIPEQSPDEENVTANVWDDAKAFWYSFPKLGYK